MSRVMRLPDATPVEQPARQELTLPAMLGVNPGVQAQSQSFVFGEWPADRYEAFAAGALVHFLQMPPERPPQPSR